MIKEQGKTACGIEQNSPHQPREGVLTVRVTFHTFDTLKRAARERGVSVSDVVREAIK